MALRRHVGLSAAIVSSTILGTAALPAVAAHAAGTTITVANGAGWNCSDTGPGTEVQPYCHIQPAVDAAQPGDTVVIMPGQYQEQVTLHSGTPGNPITITGDTASAGSYPSPGVRVGIPTSKPAAQTSPHAFLASGVHDVTIQHVGSVRTLQEAVLVENSDHVNLDGDAFFAAGSAVRVTGKSTNTTISRTRVIGSGAGIAVDAGVSGTVITTNSVTYSRGGGIVVTDAPGTVVTSNSVALNCQGGIVLAGNSSGATIENNITTSNVNQQTPCTGPGGEVDLSVSADSVTGTKADYNIVHPASGGVGYSWGGSTYASSAAFNAATGQGGHDLDTDPKLNLVNYLSTYLTPAADSPAIDSADANAPGELTSDLTGQARVDDPLVKNTGTGVGYYDRGAIELQDPLITDVAAYPGAPGHPMDATITGTVSSPWYPTTATLDFGDGQSAPATFPTTHTYAAPGQYPITLTVKETGGRTVTSIAAFTLNAPADIYAGMLMDRDPGNPTRLYAYSSSTKSPWPVASYSFDFGDGTPAQVFPGPNDPGRVPHDYAAPGQYTVRMTVLDDHGRSAVAASAVGMNFPLPGDIPVAGKWSGWPSRAGMFNGGVWALRSNGPFGDGSGTKVGFGQAGDLPAVGDWDGRNYDQLGIYRQGLFALRHDDGSVTVVPFGAPGDLPVPGYWDHNGHAQLAIYRPSIRTFAVRHDDGSVSTATFGDAGDIPLVGDWDGVGHTQMAIYRPSAATFALRHDDGSVTAAPYGDFGDQPLVGDWAGTGRTSFGIYRASSSLYAFSNAYAGRPDAVLKLF